jgi:hypothetical protein
MVDAVSAYSCGGSNDMVCWETVADTATGTITNHIIDLNVTQSQSPQCQGQLRCRTADGVVLNGGPVWTVVVPSHDARRLATVYFTLGLVGIVFFGILLLLWVLVFACPKTRINS